MAKQTCKDCDGQGMWLVDMGDAVDGCRTCDGTGTIHRTGPYRLADGTWSDGVDRSKRIDTRTVSARFEVTVGKYKSHVWHEAYETVEFDTWAEAIRYADHHARTTKNGDA